MTARALADAVVTLHALFVVFALLGGALVLWQPRIAIVHLPAAAWAAWVEFTGRICPLTPLENEFRRAAGAAYVSALGDEMKPSGFVAKACASNRITGAAMAD